MEGSGILWVLQVVIGPIILGIALVYATFRYRRRRRLGELNFSAREIVTLVLPVVIAVALFTLLMMIPGSQ